MIKVIFFLIFCYVIVVGIARFLTPKIDEINILKITAISKDIMKLNDKDIVCTLQNSPSCVVVKERGKRYEIKLLKNSCFTRGSVILHEMVHISTGQSDRMHKKPRSMVNIIRNLFYDFFYAWPTEIRFALSLRSRSEPK